jgi:hypothetical protein
MRLITIKWFIYAVFSGVLIIACAGPGTKLTHIWVDEAHRGNPVSDILVIGLTYKDNEEVRRSFEDSFVRHLRATGIEAISSVDAISIPANMKLEKEEILKAVNKYNNDAVIITHLVDKEAKEVYNAPSHEGYFGYYGWAYGYSHSASYSRTRTSVRLATNLYDVKTEKLIWSGKSKTLNPDSTKQMIDDVIKVVIKDLQKNNLLLQK